MLLAVSGGAGLLSHLRASLQSHTHNRVRLSKATRRQLSDLHRLATDVAARPTRPAELFSAVNGHFYGACDASGLGFGSALLPGPHNDFAPGVWRFPLPRLL